MFNVNIDKLSIEKVSKMFFRTRAILEKLEDVKSECREKLIKFYKEGVSTKSFGINVIPVQKVDWKKTKDNWEKEKDKLPTKFVPEHDEIDIAKFKSLIKKNPKLKIMGNKTYQVKSNKPKKSKKSK